MSREIIERVVNVTGERPIKGLATDKTMYIYDTKQEVLDEQAISNGRVANLVVWAKDIAKWLVFNEDGSDYDEKDMPSGDVDLSEYAKKLELVKVHIGGEDATVDSLDTGVGLTWVFDANSKELKFSNEYALRDKISYSDKTSSTTSTGQGKLIEFVGAGTSSAQHQHTFTDSGTFWASNFQVTNMRPKVISVNTPTGVTSSGIELPVNMVLRSSYCKDTNKIITECSYLRPELIDYVPASYVTEQLEINNDDIITPEQGEVFQFIDDTVTDGYGVEGGTRQTYWSPNDGLQKDLLTSQLAYSKVFCVHRKINSTSMFLMVHEDYAAQIYNKDVTGVNELTMLFGPNSRGRFAAYNQTAPDGSVWNWNGQAIPEANDPNELQPTVWITPEGGETTEWSTKKEVIATCCYSSGTLANDGSAILRRGDVRFDPATKTSSFEADSSSPFYVMPIRSGGGTFNDIKVFSFFMSRKYKNMVDWDSYTFEDSASCIGTILKIAYDAAIEVEDVAIQSQEDELLEGLAFGKIYAKTVQVG